MITFLQNKKFWLLYLTLCFGIAPISHGQEEQLINYYEVSNLNFIYGGSYTELPSLEPLKEIQLSIGEKTFTISEVKAGANISNHFSLRQIQEISQLPIQYLKSKGYEGIVAFPNPNQIHPISAKDLRDSNDKSLQIVVWVSHLQSVELQNLGVNNSLFGAFQRSSEEYFSAKGETSQPLISEDLRFWKRYGSGNGRTSITSLKPGNNPGDVIAVVKIGLKQKQGWSLYASNAGTATTGKWILGGSFSYNQMSERDDDIQISYLSSDTRERQAFNAKYSLPLMHPGILHLDLQAGYSSYDASSFAITRIDFEGETRSLDVSLRWNPLHLEKDNYQVGLELGVKGEDVESENSLISGRADVQMLTPRIGVSLQTKGTYLKTMTRLQVRRNTQDIQAFDRSLLGGVNAVDKSTRLQLTYFESLKLGKWIRDHLDNDLPEFLDRQILLSRFSADVGLENKRHLPQHQFISGGTGSVRGYPESPIAGDSGYFASIEYRMPVGAIEQLSSLGTLSTTLIPFFDWAETFTTDPLPYESDKSIAGAGIGLEMKFSKGLQARVDFAKPLKEINNAGAILDGTKSNDSRVHVMLVWKF